MQSLRWFATACLTLAPQLVWGHAVLLQATPRQGQLVPFGPVAVSLRFNSRIDGQRSRLFLVGANGSEQNIAVLPQSAPDKLDARIPGVNPGRCRIGWQVLASDGHITRGQLEFKVK